MLKIKEVKIYDWYGLNTIPKFQMIKRKDKSILFEIMMIFQNEMISISYFCKKIYSDTGNQTRVSCAKSRCPNRLDYTRSIYLLKKIKLIQRKITKNFKKYFLFVS